MAVIMCKELVVPERVRYIPWIESTGTQCIDTGVRQSKNGDIKIVHDAQFESQSRTFAGADYYMQWNVSSFYAIVSSASVSVSVGNRDIVELHYKNNASTLYVNGTAVATYSWSSISAGEGLKIGVFGMYTKHDALYSAATQKGKLYSCQIYDNDVLVRDFWPCYDLDGVVCLYDKVEKKYYYNTGTGEFIAGGSGGGSGGESGKITFTVAGTTYTAEDGMTWAEFVNSSYNTGGFYLEGTPGGTFVSYDKNGTPTAMNYNGDNVRSTDVIVAGGAYT